MEGLELTTILWKALRFSYEFRIISRLDNSSIYDKCNRLFHISVVIQFALGLSNLVLSLLASTFGIK